jgi:hypothetical protein
MNTAFFYFFEKETPLRDKIKSLILKKKTMPIVGSIIKKALELKHKLPAERRKAQPAEQQQKVLKKMLRKAQITAFGEQYQFETILKNQKVIDEFQKRVPVYDYTKMHHDWWYRTLSGESFVTWPGKVKYFALSSGTSEASSKYIPITQDMIRAIKKTSIRQLVSLAQYDLPKDFFERGILMLGGSTHLNFNGTYFEGDLSGITAGTIPFWFQHHYKPGKRLSKERNWNTKLEEIVSRAPEWDIGAIVGVPAWLQILMERIIQRYNVKTIHDIWPNLKIFCHGGVSFTPYMKSFEKLIEKPLIYIETYLASEGFIAYQNIPEVHSMQLVLDNGLFYEFVPFTDDNFDQDSNIIDHPQTLTIENIKEGVDYALLITTVAGAWRYLIGDVIRFTSVENYQIQIMGRTKHYLSMCGEHLSVENMNRAIEMLDNEFNLGIREFAVAGIPNDPMFAHQWWIGSETEVDNIVAAQKIDEFLKVLNDDYRVERLAAIRDVRVKILSIQVFYEFMKMKGKEGGQHKFPRVLKGEMLRDWVAFVEQHNT